MNKKLFDFIKKSPTPFHAVKTVCETLSEKGYFELCESEKWNLEAGKGYFVYQSFLTRIWFIQPPITWSS